jgi:hypothetical protein
MTTFFNEASAFADIKHTLRSYDALTFVRMKRSATNLLRVAKPRFMGRSLASFFMRRGALH